MTKNNMSDYYIGKKITLKRGVSIRERAGMSTTGVIVNHDYSHYEGHHARPCEIRFGEEKYTSWWAPGEFDILKGGE